MKHYNSENIKNIALLGGSKSGKTTLAECMMFEGGVISRMGNIEDKNTVSDYHEAEHDRQNSVFSSVMHTEWRGTKINLIDTPGMPDYIGEVIPALRVCDTSLLLVNIQNGVEVGTEIMMRYLRKYNKPTILVVNQLDHPKANWDTTVSDIQSQFSENVVLVQYPYNAGEGFDSIIDLLKMVMYKFPAGGGKPEKLSIPDEEKEKAEALHNTLVEAAAENDDKLMELYFDKGELDEDEMRQGIREGMLKRDMVPLFCLAAKKNMGSGRLMGFLGNVAPSAGDVAPEITKTGGELKATDADPTLLIFKTFNEKHAGTISYFKICSGEISSGLDMYNTSSDTKNRLSQLYVNTGKNREGIEKLSAGDIGATVKLKGTKTDHTLRLNDDDVELAPIQFPDPKIRTAIYPEKEGDEEKLGIALNKIHEGDPTCILEHSKELRQMLLHAQGGMHLQMIKWLLKHDHGLEVEFKKPRISYRETIRTQAEGQYKHKKQSGGSGQFAEVSLRIYPYSENFVDPTDIKIRKREVIDLKWGGKLVMCNAIVGGAIDARFIPAILKGVMELLEQGPLTKSYARDIIVVVYDGRMHDVDSNEISFKIAGRAAFKEAFLKAKPMLMEPIYKVKVLSPSDYTGDIMTDLQGRRALVEGMEADGPYQKITARVPLAEMYQYVNSLSSITQGRATYNREFLEYAQVPGDVQGKLVAELSSDEE